MTKTTWTARHMTRQEMDELRKTIAAETGLTVRVELAKGRYTKGTVNVLPQTGTRWTSRELKAILNAVAPFAVNFMGSAEYGPLNIKGAATATDGLWYLVKVEAA